MNEQNIPKSEFIFYTTPNGDIKIEVFLADETIWLTQKKMAELFDVTPQNITIHLKNIFETNELDRISTCKEFLQVQNEGGRKINRKLEYYNLDAIIAVGYRVNSKRATQFCIWATQILKNYIIKGFAIDDERLKQGEKVFGKDYFKEFLEKVRFMNTRFW